MTAGLNEILECSNKVLTGRNDISNTVKDAAVVTDTLLGVDYKLVLGSQCICEPYKVEFTV